MNESHDTSDVISKVRAALGRREPLRTAPVPPGINEPIVRLVHSEIGLPELFAKKASDNKMGVEMLYVEELLTKLIDFLKSMNCRRLALPVSDFLQKLNVPQALRDAGFEVRLWDAGNLDELFDFDAGVTDVYCAVAETGSLVVRSSVGHGKSISLVPPIHVAILQPKDFVPDLVDLFEKLHREGIGSNVVLITGPSKTSDIEMTLVQGVHGPKTVQLFILK